MIKFETNTSLTRSSPVIQQQETIQIKHAHYYREISPLQNLSQRKIHGCLVSDLKVRHVSAYVEYISSFQVYITSTTGNHQFLDQVIIWAK